ncbi:MAG: putative polymerase subfamily sigma factor [Frankiales bacterium]|nr:putative polymerase subfamily sigma factor [Frankiales bacterium]
MNAAEMTPDDREDANAPATGRARSLAVVAGDAFSDYRDGDPNRMSDLVRAVTPILWHTVRSYRLDNQSAEDVLQSTWMALVRRADSIADPRAVLQWLIVTARHEAWRVATAQRKVNPTDWENDDLIASVSDQPEPVVVQDAQDATLWSQLEQLSPRCQQLLRVIAFADRPDYTELARALGMPVGSIGPTRGRCLAKLRASLRTDARWEDR